MLSLKAAINGYKSSDMELKVSQGPGWSSVLSKDQTVALFKEAVALLIEAEAEVVRQIFGRYLELGHVRLLKEELDRRGVVSKSHSSANGVRQKGYSFSRGALYVVLSNPLYVGEIRHRGVRHPGQHPASVASSMILFDDSLRITDAENRELSKLIDTLLLVAAGGEPSDAAVVWRYAAEDRNAAVASGIGGLQGAANFGDEIGSKGISVRERGRKNAGFRCLYANARQNWSVAT